MQGPRPANFRGVFPDMMPSSMQPVWMFQPDAFPCSPSPRPCSQSDAFPCFTSLRNCGSSCVPQRDTSPSSPEARPAPQPKQAPSDFTQKVMSDLFGDILTTGKEDVVNERKEQKSRKQKMSRRNAKKSKNQVLTDFLIDTLEGFCAPQSKKAQKWTHLVDCSGFKSENIYVKVLEGCIIVRGEKEEHGEDGSISVTSIEKHIKLPQKLKSEKVSCRLLPNSRLLIEAPYISEKEETDSPLESSSSVSEEDNSMSEDIPRETTSSKNVGGENSDEAETTLESKDTNNDYKESCVEEYMLEDQESPMMNADDVITEPMMDQVDETPNKTGGLQGLQRMHSLTYCQPPAITMKEKAADKHTANENSFQVRLEMMCHHPESIRVTMDDATNTLNICARKDSGNGNHDETTTTVVVKQLRVPDAVDVQHLKCQFQDGLLSITAPFKSQSIGGGGTRRDIPVCM